MIFQRQRELNYEVTDDYDHFPALRELDFAFTADYERFPATESLISSLLTTMIVFRHLRELNILS